ncbi:WXG100 family type VII secretion target [Longispora sp. NPDC051575]|uniref:WXG100 family type VII secretion target n=1 Tax=Longispora sp. NPDC051575 TaxID=3154943 RepID=UPI003442FDE2
MGQVGQHTVRCRIAPTGRVADLRPFRQACFTRGLAATGGWSSVRDREDSSGQASQTAVDPAALRQLGGEVSGAAAAVGNAHSKAHNRLAPAGQATGSEALDAARTAATRWYTTLATTSSRLATAATNLTAAANAYEQADTQAADRNRQLHQLLDPDTGRPPR